MTLHTRAATDEVLDMFNQTLRNVASITDAPESGPESDFEDDDYTSGGESTGTGRISGATSECGDETEAVQSSVDAGDTEVTDVKSVSPWSDFTKSKHMPIVEGEEDTEQEDVSVPQSENRTQDEAVVTPIVGPQHEELETRFIPEPLEGVIAPTHPYRDAEQINQNRLPFMTPIVEMTESSIGMPSTRQQKDYFNSKTPSRRRNEADPALPEIEDLLIDDRTLDVEDATTLSRGTRTCVEPDFDAQVWSTYEQSRPIIQDAQCNPVED